MCVVALVSLSLFPQKKTRENKANERTSEEKDGQEKNMHENEMKIDMRVKQKLVLSGLDWQGREHEDRDRSINMFAGQSM